MHLLPLLLLLGCLWAHKAVSVGGPPNSPYFFDVSYWDDVPLEWYDSKTELLEPRAPWMKDMVDPAYWWNRTQELWYLQKISRSTLLYVMKEMNQTKGVHTYQIMEGCDVSENTSFGFFRTAFDGADFLSITTDTEFWVAEMPEAEAKAEARNANETLTQQFLQYLDVHCYNAEVFLSFANETLPQSDEPNVRVKERRLPNDSVTLYCHANGFYPSYIEMTWMTNGAETQVTLDPENILPNPDRTYQAIMSLSVTSETRDDYSCLVRHSSLEEDKIVLWDRGQMEPPPEQVIDRDKDQEGLSIGGIIGVVVALVAFVFAVTLGLVAWQKRRRAEAFGERFLNT
uniref:Major histocompatibility complex class I-related gene protein-like isoform X2 n=1 Tax=Geotrypetes seraphini TaxID=260995 RepID=A0A6P8NSW8_GEOSA|nr:major histocompatibility complex class I-related gene protein-like isoform X2 [Geotrypetes seraphini]